MVPGQTLVSVRKEELPLVSGEGWCWLAWLVRGEWVLIVAVEGREALIVKREMVATLMCLQRGRIQAETAMRNAASDGEGEHLASRGGWVALPARMDSGVESNRLRRSRGVLPPPPKEGANDLPPRQLERS